MNSSDSTTRPTNVRWIVFALGCATSWMLYLHRYAFGLIKPYLEQEWGLDKEQLGDLDAAFAVFYTAFQIPCGILTDLAGPHLFLGGMILLWSISLGLMAWAPNAKWMALIQSVFGAAQAGVYPALSRLSRSWFPFSTRTTVQGWIGVFFGRMGGVSANILFASVLIGFFLLDWRTAVCIFSGLGIALGVLFLLLFRNSPRAHPWVNVAEADLIEDVVPQDQSEASRNTVATICTPAPAKRMTVRELLARTNTRSTLNLSYLCLQTTLSTIADFVYSAWVPSFLKDEFSMGSMEIGMLSALPLLGGAIGGAVGGSLNDWAIRRFGNRRWARSGVSMAGKGMAAVCLFAALLAFRNPYVFCSCLFVVKFFSDWSLAGTWGTVTDIGREASATVYAINNSIASVGQVAAAKLYGRIAKYYGWQPMFIIVASVYVVCALSWLAVNCTIPVLADKPPEE